MLKRLIHGTVADVAGSSTWGEGGWKALMDRRLAPVDWTLETLGIDEVALLKGHGHYVAVVWMRDAGDNHVLAVLPDRLRATVQAFLADDTGRPEKPRCGGSAWMGKATPARVAAALPDAQIVVDRFHVAVRYREAVDALRQTERRRLNAERTPMSGSTAELQPCSAGNGGRSIPIKGQLVGCSS